MTTFGTIGIATIDTLLYVKGNSDYDYRAQGDQIVEIEQREFCLGGKGLLVAQGLAKLGHAVIPLCFSGKDLPDAVIEEPKIDPSLILCQMRDHHRTWITIKDVADTVTFVQLADQPFMPPEWLGSVDSLLSRVDALYISYDQPWILQSVLSRITMLHRPALVVNLCAPLLLACQGDHQQTLEALIDQAAFLLMNAEESSLALDILGLGSWSELDGTNLKEVVITMGDRGGFVTNLDGTVLHSYQAATCSKAVCAVGAGDAFNSAYLSARLGKSLTISESCEFAAATAALKVSQRTSVLQLD